MNAKGTETLPRLRTLTKTLGHAPVHASELTTVVAATVCCLAVALAMILTAATSRNLGLFTKLLIAGGGAGVLIVRTLTRREQSMADMDEQLAATCSRSPGLPSED